MTEEKIMQRLEAKRKALEDLTEDFRVLLYALKDTNSPLQYEIEEEIDDLGSTNWKLERILNQ